MKKLTNHAPARAAMISNDHLAQVCGGTDTEVETGTDTEDELAASGLPTGKRQHKPFYFSKPTDKALT